LNTALSIAEQWANRSKLLSSNRSRTVELAQPGVFLLTSVELGFLWEIKTLLLIEMGYVLVLGLASELKDIPHSHQRTTK
jgi:hypothetical protein